eukprot:TRINITY_DN17998_c2_g1_i1.p1 TRINITY_DN17998_c2_g1~~TRINITY_DN17998_c2_g1_i1.p1  ORF type:complete len:535 (+),score=157.60 TRINITY_DN17998_c2_g1_i1:80-1606(+)
MPPMCPVLPEPVMPLHLVQHAVPLAGVQDGRVGMVAIPPGMAVVARGPDMHGRLDIAGQLGIVRQVVGEGAGGYAVVDFPPLCAGLPPRRHAVAVAMLVPAQLQPGLTLAAPFIPTTAFSTAVPQVLPSPTVETAPTPQRSSTTASTTSSRGSPPVSPRSCRVIVLKEVPWTASMSQLKADIEEAFPAQVVRMLALWNKGMVLAQLSAPVVMRSRRVPIGQGVVAEASDKTYVKTAEPSPMLNARFVVLDPARDAGPVPPGEGEAAAHEAALRMWPRGGRRQDQDAGPSQAVLMRLGAELEALGGEPWQQVAIPLCPMRETEQHLSHCRRLYTQLFFQFRDAKQAARAAERGDGAVFQLAGLRWVLRLEPVAPTAVAGTPRRPHPSPSQAVPPVGSVSELVEDNSMPQLLDCSPATPHGVSEAAGASNVENRSDQHLQRLIQDLQRARAGWDAEGAPPIDGGSSVRKGAPPASGPGSAHSTPTNDRGSFGALLQCGAVSRAEAGSIRE